MPSARAVAKRVLPVRMQRGLSVARGAKPRRDLKQLLARADTEPRHLPLELIGSLPSNFPDPPEYGYDLASMERRAAGVVGKLEKLAGSLRGQAVLELGARDGMTSRAVMLADGRATALDLDITNIEHHALDAGVQVVEGDATALPFSDASFDVVFTINALEHIDDPRAAVGEALRVLRPGGLLFTEYGPLYNSASGFHIAAVPIPYCHLLWDPRDLMAFVRSRPNLQQWVPFVNGWSLAQHRSMIAAAKDSADVVRYWEHLDLSAVGMIHRYPSCFASVSRDPDEFVVWGLEIGLRKRPT
jgi:SAM-dependent methyltransferase